jgi:hypothetical protein
VRRGRLGGQRNAKRPLLDHFQLPLPSTEAMASVKTIALPPEPFLRSGKMRFGGEVSRRGSSRHPMFMGKLASTGRRCPAFK